MNIVDENHEGRTILRLKEDRLAHSSAELQDHILKLLETRGLDIIVDLHEVTFIDSPGLGALLSGHKNAIERSCGFALAGLQPRVKSLFELTRLNRVFAIYHDLCGLTQSERA